nr:uncharacterized protein LOC101138086 isoform X3 [Gorilla gorilla gorilla]
MPAPDLSSEGGKGRATRPDEPSPSGGVGRAPAIFRPWSWGSPGQPRRTREPSGACTCGFREPGGPRGAGARLTALRGSLGLRGRRPPVSLLKGGPGGIADSGLDRRLEFDTKFWNLKRRFLKLTIQITMRTWCRKLHLKMSWAFIC